SSTSLIYTLSLHDALPIFGCQNDLISSRSQGASEKIFALPFTIPISGIEERNSRFDRCVDNFRARLRINAPAEIIAAKSDDRNFEGPNLARLHCCKMK